MDYIVLPDIGLQKLTFYLSMEEYVARHFKDRECFFMWQVNPTVILGRNQLIDTEINMSYCQENGIDVYRRKSGGGCVYADRSNIMLAFITSEQHVGFTFQRYIQQIVHLLRNLGIDAKASGRNDISIEGKKVSGNAFYKIGNRSIVHGTMLFNTEIETLVRAITPSNEKLISKGIASLRQRVTNLSEYISLDIESFKKYIRNSLCDSEIILNSEDISAITQLEKEYLSPAFIKGNNPRYMIVNQKKIESVGEIKVEVELKNNKIKTIRLYGDFFVIKNWEEDILSLLSYQKYERETIEFCLKDIRMEEYILHLTNWEFINLLFDGKECISNL